MHRTLVGKTVIVTIAILGVCMFVIMMAAQTLVRDMVQAKFERNSVSLSKMLANQVNTATRLKRGSMVEPVVASVVDESGLPINGFRITNVDGTEVFVSAVDEVSSAFLEQLAEPSFSMEVSQAVFGDYLVVQTPVFFGAGESRAYVGEMSVLWDMVPFQTALNRVISILAVVYLGGAAIVAIALAVTLFKVASRPLNGAIAAMNALADEKELPTLPTSKSTEIASILDALGVFKRMQDERAEFQRAEEESRQRAEVEREKHARAEKDAARQRQEDSAQKQKTSEEEEARSTKLIEQLTVVLDAATAGDFSKRLELSKDGGERDKVRQMVNSLLETTNDGLSATSAVLQKLADRNMTAKMHGDFKGAFLALQINANSTAKGLSSAITEIRSHASDLATNSTEVASNSTLLASQTEKTANTMNQTTESLSQLSSRIRETAERTSNVQRTAVKMTEEMGQSQSVVEQAVSTMTEIRENSTEMKSIVDLIDNVAFQTNLLALNAGVEAARAGDSGRGFAVVASEVRELAQRASNAAREISELISSNSNKVEIGSELIAKAGETIQELNATVLSVSSTVAEIATSTSEQANEVSGLNGALVDVGSQSQLNAAMLEETTAANSAMNSASTELAQLVGRFVVEGDDGGAPAAGDTYLKSA